MTVMKKTAKEKAAERRAIDRFAKDAEASLRVNTNVGISASNYGLTISADVMGELMRRLGPAVTVTARGGFMQYVSFERTAP